MQVNIEVALYMNIREHFTRLSTKMNDDIKAAVIPGLGVDALIVTVSSNIVADTVQDAT